MVHCDNHEPSVISGDGSHEYIHRHDDDQLAVILHDGTQK